MWCVQLYEYAKSPNRVGVGERGVSDEHSIIPRSKPSQACPPIKALDRSSIHHPTDPPSRPDPLDRKRMEPRIRRPRRRPRPEWLPVLLLLHSSPVAGRRHAAPAAAFIPSHPSRPPSWRPPLQLGSSITTDDDDAPRYAARGVSAYKGEVLAAVGQRQPHDQPPQPPPLLPSLYPDAFCRLVPDVLTGSLEHALVMHADGAFLSIVDVSMI